MKYIRTIVFTTMLFWLVCGCNKEKPKTARVNEIETIKEYDKYGKFHNDQVNLYLSMIENSKTDIDLEDFYPMLIEAISEDFNIDVSELPEYDFMVAIIDEFLDSLNTLTNVVDDQNFELQEQEKDYFYKLDSLIFLALSDEDFINEIEALQLDVVGDNNLLINSKDRLLISISIAKYSRELWIEQYQGNMSFFPWGLIDADAGGALLGLVVGGGTPYGVGFGVFASLSYLKFSSNQ